MSSDKENRDFFKFLVDVGALQTKPFSSPETSLGGLDVGSTAQLVAAASDVALVIDREGVIRDVAFGSEELSRRANESWIGQPWAELVTVESRPKVEALLREAAWPASHKWRHVNHQTAGGDDVPVLYSTVQVGEGNDSRVIAFGRDLRSVAALQQRLVDAQQSIERDFFRQRQLETRYRMLFQMSAEPVMIVDAATQTVVEANPAATQMLGRGPKGLLGSVFPEGFDDDSAHAIQLMLSTVRASGRADDIRARLVEGGREFMVSASLVRQENSPLFLVRLSAQQPVAAAPSVPGAVLQIVDSSPDAFVLTDSQGRVTTVNQAFVELAQLATAEQARGKSLDHWLGRPGIDADVLMANVRQRGKVRAYATSIRGEQGSSVEVEISGVGVVHEDKPCMGFIVRSIVRRLDPEPFGMRPLPRSADQLKELVGRVPLKDLVRESTDVIERMCIEAALELTRDNRASAAEMLGLSRQSLYVKMRRYGLGDYGADLEGIETENALVNGASGA